MLSLCEAEIIGKSFIFNSMSPNEIIEFCNSGVCERKSFSKGDVSGDSRVDSVDASAILKEYSLISSGKNGTFTEQQSIAADWNGDDHIDSVDASAILAKYAELQTL